MPGSIAKNATIADVLPDLVAPESYVRGVLETMYRFKANSPFVVIGISGKGLYPQYRILAQQEDGSETILGTFNDNGTELPTAQASMLSWSAGRMSLDDVAQTLGAIRQKR